MNGAPTITAETTKIFLYAEQNIKIQRFQELYKKMQNVELVMVGK